MRHAGWLLARRFFARPQAPDRRPAGRLASRWTQWTGRVTGGMMAALAAAAPATYQDWDQPPHSYFERTPTDRFTRLKDRLESGELALDRGNEKAFLLGLLDVLGIPASSQMLVFSTTSLQLGLISPANPRALYFNEDLYVGFIPGGRIEVVSLDPDLGAVFYILDRPREGQPLRAERSTRCMNCHAGEETGFVPGLTIKSVLPGVSGGSLDSFRRNQSGHAIPLAERFGGWHVTGVPGFTNHWGNRLGESAGGTVTVRSLRPGERFDWGRYPVATSDLLPQLLHEHQAGLVNRAVGLTYRARAWREAEGPAWPAKHAAELEQQARELVRYLLFADEAPLPPGGVGGSEAYREDFRRGRREVEGESLKDFDLATRLFRHRCSYMIYSPVFRGLPAEARTRVLGILGEALDDRADGTEGRHLPRAEKQRIRRILRATLPDLPPGW
ncbi:MAG: hypothetical protein ACKO3N_20025 [Verrucomicrobiota bacterium]